MGQQKRRKNLLSIYRRHRWENRKLKQVILNEFCAETGSNRKYAIRLPTRPPPSRVRTSCTPCRKLWTRLSCPAPSIASSNACTHRPTTASAQDHQSLSTFGYILDGAIDTLESCTLK